MKKILFFTIVGCLLNLVACSDFLDEKPLSSIEKGDFFQSRDDGFAAVNILYRKGMMDHFRTGSFVGSTYLYSQVYRAGGLIDNTLGKNNNPFIGWILTLTMNTQYADGSQVPGGLWTGPYEVISRNANYALENLPDCLGLSDAERKQLIGEASFFRALNYYYLVSIFGPIPIVLNSYASIDDIYVQRSSEKLVYEQILKDLQVAIDAGLPDRPMPANGFRISRGSVLALAADVCLNMAGYPVQDKSKYADAARYAKMLIESPNYALIQHGADMSDPDNWGKSAYNTLRTSDNEKEHLLVKEYDTTIQNASEQPTWCLPWNATTWKLTYPVYVEAYLPDLLLLAAYDPDNDLRFQERQYFHTTYTDKDGNKHDFDRPHPFFWWEEVALTSTQRAEKDWNVYRLAEMYLTAAEALVEAGGSVTDEAAGYLATIQARASLNKSYETIKTELMALSKEAFINEVLTERIRELLFEAKIWRDIARTRKYPAYDADKKFSFVPLIGAKPVANPETTYTENQIYFPYPLTVTQRNPLMAEEPLK